jgi:hypothetical protein
MVNYINYRRNDNCAQYFHKQLKIQEINYADDSDDEDEDLEKQGCSVDLFLIDFGDSVKYKGRKLQARFKICFLDALNQAVVADGN